MTIFNDFELLDFINIDEIIWETSAPDNVLITSTPGVTTVNALMSSVVCLLPKNIGEVFVSISISDIDVVPPDVIIIATTGQVVAYSQCTGLIAIVLSIPGEILSSAIVSEITSYCFVISPPAEFTVTANGVICFGLPNVSAQVIFSSACETIRNLFSLQATIVASGHNQNIHGFSNIAGVTRSYRAIITKTGMADLIVPISRLTSRQHVTDLIYRRNPSFTEVTTPCLDQLVDIMARVKVSGFAMITMWGVLATPTTILQQEPLFTANIETMVIFGNDSYRSITLSGYGIITAPNYNPAVYPLSGVTYRSMDRGTLTLRTIATDLCLRAGDTVTYDGDSMTAGIVTYTMDALLGVSIDIREAA